MLRGVTTHHRVFAGFFFLYSFFCLQFGRDDSGAATPAKTAPRGRSTVMGGGNVSEGKNGVGGADSARILERAAQAYTSEKPQSSFYSSIEGWISTRLGGMQLESRKIFRTRGLPIES